MTIKSHTPGNLVADKLCFTGVFNLRGTNRDQFDREARQVIALSLRMTRQSRRIGSAS